MRILMLAAAESVTDASSGGIGWYIALLFAR